MEILWRDAGTFDDGRLVFLGVSSLKGCEELTFGDELQVAQSGIQRDGGGITDCDFFDARQAPGATQHFTQEWRLLRRGPVQISFRIVGLRQPGPNGPYVLRVKSQTHIPQSP